MQFLTKPIHRSHRLVEVAEVGRTFICGDLHGCYDELMHELERVAFNFVDDRLIALGDITDRGIKNYECVQLLSEPWFSSVLGNHDVMMLNSVSPLSDKAFWRANGGGWFDLLSTQQQQEVEFLCQSYVEHLPLSMTIKMPDGSHVGLLHADPPEDWLDTVTGTHPGMEILWGRKRIRSQKRQIVQNVDIVLVGHTSNNEIIELGNVVYLDTGAGFQNGRLTVLELGKSIGDLKDNIAARKIEDRLVPPAEIIFDPIGRYPMDDIA